MVSVGFLIKCDESLLESSCLTYFIDHTRCDLCSICMDLIYAMYERYSFHRLSEGPYVFAYLCNEEAPNMSNPPHEGTHRCILVVLHRCVSAETKLVEKKNVSEAPNSPT